MILDHYIVPRVVLCTSVGGGSSILSNAAAAVQVSVYHRDLGGQKQGTARESKGPTTTTTTTTTTTEEPRTAI